MGLFHFIEKQDAIWSFANSVSQHASLVMANVAGGRANELTDAVLFHIFGHVEANKFPLIAEEKLSERFGQLSLANSGGSSKKKHSVRTTGIGKPRHGRSYLPGHGVNRMVLADDSFSKRIFHPQQAQLFIRGQALNGDTRPLSNNLGHVIAGNALLICARRLTGSE